MSNRLAGAPSPYLRQHANNPVNWYPWGKEAFARAKKENRPIFLSIGYSTCHWCHVMGRESFENEEVAKILNKYFVAIKVDRERRPDVDETYMIATQIITHGGGWPNSLFLTPDLKPFYAGTYFPRARFMDLTRQIGTQWAGNEKALRADGEQISNVIRTILNRRIEAASITPDVLSKAGQQILRDADEFFGGFDTAPKFPNEPILMFLLQLAAGHKDEKALETVTRTLDAILDGGIHDHVGGGFHRYATDNEWHIPHFEKMLYNQAQMVRVLLQAYRLTGRERYARAAERTIAFVDQHMTSKEGGFYSAYDADSAGREGTFYVWTIKQLNQVLGEREGALAATIFGVTARGNFEGDTVLHFPESPLELAASLKMTKKQFWKLVSRLVARLDKARSKRVPPDLDDKIVLSWNGMMITAIAEASIILEKPQYVAMAEHALSFIETNMKQKGGSFVRSYYKGRAELEAQQKDYAWLALAYTQLYDATQKQKYLDKAEDITSFMIKTFADPAAGDFYMVATSDTFIRGKTRSDGATPSGNSTALEVFAMLTRRSRLAEYRNRGEALLAALSGLAVKTPRSASYALRGADMILHGETGPVQYFAKGTVRAVAKVDQATNEAVVTLHIAPGWHINSHQPFHKDLIATRLFSLSDAVLEKKTIYPTDIRRKLKFSTGKMSLYEGTMKIKAPLGKHTARPVRLKLTLQACSEQICLEPVEGNLLIR